MDAPGLFAHGNDARFCIFRGSEMDVAHFCERVANGVVDGAFADFAALDVGDGNAKGQGNACGSQHFVAIGNEKEQVRANLRQRIGQRKSGQADGFGHADIGIGTKQAFEAGGDGDLVAFDFANGLAELRREVRGQNDEFQVDLGVSKKVFQGPVEMAVIGARGSDYGDGALHASMVSRMDGGGRVGW
jgi:hypothetical protein